jgi:hypothetical protein
MIEARCPKCRSPKDPVQPLCGPCALNEKTERTKKMTDRLNKIPTPILFLIAVFLVLLHYAQSIVCLFVAYHYGKANVDLAAIWLMLAVLFFPTKGTFERDKQQVLLMIPVDKSDVKE